MPTSFGALAVQLHIGPVQSNATGIDRLKSGGTAHAEHFPDRHGFLGSGNCHGVHARLYTGVVPVVLARHTDGAKRRLGLLCCDFIAAEFGCADSSSAEPSCEANNSNDGDDGALHGSTLQRKGVARRSQSGASAQVR